MPEDIKEARSLNKVEFERVVNRFLYFSANEIRAVIEHPETPALDLMIAGIVRAATLNGDHFRLNFLLDRVIGPVVKEAKVKQETKIRLSYAFDDDDEDAGGGDAEQGEEGSE